MKRVLFLLFLNAVAVAMMAQHIVVSGTVTDEQAGKVSEIIKKSNNH